MGSSMKIHLAGYFILLTIILLVVGSIDVYSCYGGPQDSVAIEVVLNKPGIVYDLDRLRSAEGVVWVGGDTYVYRSHVNSSILVIVFLDSIRYPNSEPKYLAIRVQPSIVYRNISYIEYRSNLEFKNLHINPSNIPDTARSMGWKVISYSYNPMGSKKGGTFGGSLERVIDNATIRIDFKGAYMDQGVYLTVFIDIRGNITNRVNETIHSLIREIIGHHVEIKYSGGLTTSTIMEPSVEPDKVVEALIYELEWLSSIGVVNGLSWSDIVEIRSIAKPGTAGWNGRIVYANNRWIQHYEAVRYIGGVVTAGGCRDIGRLLENLKLPGEPPNATVVSNVLYNTNMYNMLLSITIAAVSTIILWVFMRIKGF